MSLAEHLRGPLPELERNTLIGMNMRHSYRNVTTAIRARGKFVVIYSPEREFIFGDGFFHNIRSPASNPHLPKILAPLTPRISVLFAAPMRYRPEPKLSTFVASASEAELFNDAVQVYARKELFYRSEQPKIIDDYRCGQHRRYAYPNPIDEFIHHVPGVGPKDTSLDFQRREFRNR